MQLTQEAELPASNAVAQDLQEHYVALAVGQYATWSSSTKVARVCTCPQPAVSKEAIISHACEDGLEPLALLDACGSP